LLNTLDKDYILIYNEHNIKEKQIFQGVIKMKINQELKKELDLLLESSTDFEMPVNCIEGWKYLKNKIVKENDEWIIEKAYKNQNKNFNGRIYLNQDTGELIEKSMTNNTSINTYSYILIYELSSNWLSNAILEINDILDDEEWLELQNKFGKDNAYYNDRSQLKEIGIDLDDRLKEYLIWCIKN